MLTVQLITESYSMFVFNRLQALTPSWVVFEQMYSIKANNSCSYLVTQDNVWTIGLVPSNMEKHKKHLSVRDAFSLDSFR